VQRMACDVAQVARAESPRGPPITQMSGSGKVPGMTPLVRTLPENHTIA
jgi:hypothetical protein